MTSSRHEIQLTVARLALAAVTVGLCCLAAVPASAAGPRMCGVTKRAPKYTHVILIMEENTSYGSIVGSRSAPYINTVINACGLATNYHNITHPSLPNYIAITSGTPFSALTPFLPDCSPAEDCESRADNIFNELGTRWKGYAESMPAECDKSDSGPYAPRHNPAVYYADLTNCVTNDVPLGTPSSSRLLKDFAKERTAPAFTTLTPNLCDDMHGSPGCPAHLILAGDNWLKRWLSLITRTAVYRRHDTAILIVWDEGEPGTADENCQADHSDRSCHVPAIVIAPSVKNGTKSRRPLNHYSVLRTVEDLLGVARLGSAKTAASMSSAFNL
jgi:hypothetical protein